MATNWPTWRKYMTSMILSLYLFISPFSAQMVTPLLDVIGRDINIPEGPQRTLILSLPLLTAGLGPFVWAPIIENFGRKPALRYSNVVFIIFNTACGFAQNGPQLLVFRFFAAFGASSGGIVSLCLILSQHAAQFLTLTPLIDCSRADSRNLPTAHWRDRRFYARYAAVCWQGSSTHHGCFRRPRL